MESDLASQLDDTAPVRIKCCSSVAVPFAALACDRNLYREDYVLLSELQFVRKCQTWHGQVKHANEHSQKLEISTHLPRSVVQLVAEYLRHCTVKKLQKKAAAEVDVRGNALSTIEVPDSMPPGERLPNLASNADIIDALFYCNQLDLKWLENYVLQQIVGKISADVWPIEQQQADAAAAAAAGGRPVALVELFSYLFGPTTEGACVDNVARTILDATLHLLASMLDKLQESLCRELRRPVFTAKRDVIAVCVPALPVRFSTKTVVLPDGSKVLVKPLLEYLPIKTWSAFARSGLRDYHRLLQHRPGGGETGRRETGDDDDDVPYPDAGNDMRVSADIITQVPTLAVQKCLKLLFSLSACFVDATNDDDEAAAAPISEADSDNNILPIEAAAHDEDCMQRQDEEHDTPTPTPIIVEKHHPSKTTARKSRQEERQLKMRHLEVQLLSSLDEAVGYFCQIMWPKYELALLIAQELHAVSANAITGGGRPEQNAKLILGAYIESFIGYRNMLARRSHHAVVVNIKKRANDSNYGGKTVSDAEQEFRKVCMNSAVLLCAAQVAELYSKAFWPVSCEITAAGPADSGWQTSLVGSWLGCIVRCRVPVLLCLGDLYSFLCGLLGVMQNTEKADYNDNIDNDNDDDDACPFFMCVHESRNRTGAAKHEYAIGLRKHMGFDTDISPLDHCIAREVRRFLHGVSNCNVYGEPILSIITKANLEKRFLLYRNKKSAAYEAEVKNRTRLINETEVTVDMLKQIALVESKSDITLSVTKLPSSGTTGNNAPVLNTSMPVSVMLSAKMDQSIRSVISKLIGPKFLAIKANENDDDDLARLGFHLFYAPACATTTTTTASASADDADDDKSAAAVDDFVVLDRIAKGLTSSAETVVLENIELTNCDPNTTMYWLLQLRVRCERKLSAEILNSMTSAFYVHNNIAKRMDNVPSTDTTSFKYHDCRLCDQFRRYFLNPTIFRLSYEVLDSIERDYAENLDAVRNKPNEKAWYEQQQQQLQPPPALLTVCTQPFVRRDAAPVVRAWQPPERGSQSATANNWIENKYEQDLASARAYMSPNGQRKFDNYYDKRREKEVAASAYVPPLQLQQQQQSNDAENASTAAAREAVQPELFAHIRTRRDTASPTPAVAAAAMPRPSNVAPIRSRPPLPRQCYYDEMENPQNAVERANDRDFRRFFYDIYGEGALDDEPRGTFQSDGTYSAGNNNNNYSRLRQENDSTTHRRCHNIQPRPGRPNASQGWNAVRKARQQDGGSGDNNNA